MDNLRSINENENQRNFNTTAVIIALLAAVGAIAIGWAAYNRAGEDLEDQALERANEAAMEVKDATQEVGNEIEESAMEARQTATMIAIETRLAALQTRLAAEDLTQEARVEIADEIAALRADLNSAYENASEEVREEANQLDANLEEIENDVRMNTGQALAMIETLLSRMRSDVMTDEEGDSVN